MILTLIAKQRTSADGNQKWYNFSTKRGNAWYDVKFVHDCAPPKVYNIERNKDSGARVMRAFINVDETTSNVSDKGGRLTLYVNDFKQLSDAELKTAVEAERKVVEDFRAKRQKETRDFFTDGTPPPPAELATDGLLPVDDDDFPD